MDIKQLNQLVDEKFTDRTQFIMLCQELAENFYPQRADFTVTKNVGADFAANLMTSYPIITRRELGDQISTMLRPTAKEWFHISVQDEDALDNDARRWLEHKEKIQRRVMYDRRSQFTRATKEGDHDFATFGQCVISVEFNREANGLLYRNWHIRDVVWCESEEGELGLIGRKWKPTLREVVTLFKNVHEKVKNRVAKNPHEKLNVKHIVCEAEYYSEQARGRPYWSIYYDVDNNHIMEAVPVFDMIYVIPRWQTVSGSQYAFSPAAITALPDARLIQSMTYALLEAGEQAVRPPLIGVQDAVRSDVSLYAGGLTWVDKEYDERLGAALRPISKDLRGMPFGFEMNADTRTMIHQAFFINKLTMPERAPEMTAYEVGQRVQEYIRGAIPIFEPMEMDYNGALCELTFQKLMRAGGFGSMNDMPRSLAGQETQFIFESPLHDAIEEQKGQKMLEAKSLLAQMFDVDNSTIHIIDARKALRDSLSGVGVPAEWMRSIKEVDDLAAQDQQQAQQQNQLNQMEQGANVAANLSKASVPAK